MAPSRKERLAEQVKEMLSRIILFELQDPRVSFTTVTGVELSGDMRRAAVKISVMGDEKEQTVTFNTLRRAQGYVQKLLGERLKIKYVPSIRFVLDESIKKSVELSKTLREERVQEDGREEGE
jgi:ribosome-binding factor A